MSTVCPKVLFLAMDAGDKDPIQRWTEDDILPNFRQLRNSGLSMDVQNSPGLFVGSVWPSFATGLPPSRHGRYCYDQIRTGSYETPRFPVTEIDGEPFWNVHDSHVSSLPDPPRLWPGPADRQLRCQGERGGEESETPREILKTKVQQRVRLAERLLLRGP